MNISINPSYFCNFRCDFCYLTPEQLGDQKKIKPEKLDELLFESNSSFNKLERLNTNVLYCKLNFVFCWTFLILLMK